MKNEFVFNPFHSKKQTFAIWEILNMANNSMSFINIFEIYIFNIKKYIYLNFIINYSLCISCQSFSFRLSYVEK